MKGQWIGPFTGTHDGLIIVNVDELSTYYQGTITLHFNGAQEPLVSTKFATVDKAKEGRLNIGQLARFDPKTNNYLTEVELKTNYPDRIFPDAATVDYSFIAGKLAINWTTPIGTHGAAVLPPSLAATTSALVPQQMTWPAFKNFTADQPYRQMIFRGQELPWRLRSTFHRTGRSDLQFFFEQDLPALHRAVAGRTRHTYNLNVPDETGAFLHLAQHHGYPTPLLDWTYSPYVAAFNAFRRAASPADQNAKIRIFVFNHLLWRQHWSQILVLANPRLHLSVLEAISFDNDRAGPQQALSLLTNIDDVETYIEMQQGKTKATYLQAIDILASERATVMTDLARMGISAGSMFPGLDGAYEELRERLFRDWS